MKKVFYIVMAGLLVALAVSPIVGNQITRAIIENRISALTHIGVEVVEHNSSSSYLLTTHTFLFKASDINLLQTYLDQLGAQTLPPYMQTLMHGAEVLVEITHSNIPYTRDVEVVLYPISLDQSFLQPLQAYDETLAKSVEHFIATKQLQFWMTYDLQNSIFTGGVNDINYSFKRTDAKPITLQVAGITIKGIGEIESPNEIHYDIDTFALHSVEQTQQVELEAKKLQMTSIFKQRVATDALHSEQLHLRLADQQDTLDVTLKGMKTLYAREHDTNRTHLLYRSSADSIVIEHNATKTVLQTLAADIKIDNIDTSALAILQNSDSSQTAQQEKMNALLTLMQKGFTVTINTLQAERIHVADMNSSAPTTLQGWLRLKPDADVMSKLANPMQLLNNVHVELNASIDQTLYENRVKEQLMQFDAYKRPCQPQVCFDVSLENGAAKINHHAL